MNILTGVLSSCSQGSALTISSLRTGFYIVCLLLLLAGLVSTVCVCPVVTSSEK